MYKDKKYYKAFQMPKMEHEEKINGSYINLSIAAKEAGYVQRITAVKEENVQQLIKEIDKCIKKYTNTQYYLKLDFF